MFAWLANRFTGRSEGDETKQVAVRLYADIVAQARHPDFYRKLDVPDTVPGRFEMVTLHMFILLERLKGQEAASDEIAQQLVDVMFDDMDDVARELGIGDMGVAPRIKKLARSFRSRLEHYNEAINGDSRGTLPDALNEIIYRNDKERMSEAGQLAEYVREHQVKFEGMDLEEVLAVTPLFDLPRFLGDGEETDG